MRDTLTIGLVGDRDPAVRAHQAIPRALALAASALGLELRHEWVATDSIDSVERVAGFDGLWCVPGSPYRSMDGALLATTAFVAACVEARQEARLGADRGAVVG